MCLAEALLRIPDSATVDRLIRDKIGNTEWEKRLGASHSTFVNAGTWALMLTGRIVNLDNDDRNLGGTLKRLVARAGEPVIRQAVITAMRILGKQFVMGRNIHEALDRARSAEKSRLPPLLRHARRIGAQQRRRLALLRVLQRGDPGDRRRRGRPAGVRGAVDLDQALGPAPALRGRQRRSRAPRVAAGGQGAGGRAKARNVGFTIDAEEVDRLEMSLDLIEALATDPNWPAGTASAWPCRPTRSARCRPSTGSPTSRTAPTGG
jgi:RHH-type proline utilization regulon transcriptional repressor/proline dehydrogenase/delta 1-pyrroline-5-carboxylate dehydrogenase